MNTTSTRDLAPALHDISRVIHEPLWDLVIFCRFLADRLPDAPGVSSSGLASLAEEVIEDLGRGVNRRTGDPFSTPLLNDRGEIVYDHFRQRLVEAMRALVGDEFATEVESGLRFTEPIGAHTEAAPAPDEGKGSGGD